MRAFGPARARATLVCWRAAGIIDGMPDRPAPIVVTPRACPFVALDGDRDRRLDTPDPLHRCFAEQIPRARSIGHQADFCLAPTFPACPIFQDWASRAAAEPVVPRVSAVPVPEATVHAIAPGTVDPALVADVRIARTATHALDTLADDEVIATRPVPSYRAVPPTTAVPTPLGSGLASSVTVDDTGTVVRPSPALEPDASDEDIPVIRRMPAPRNKPVQTPIPEEDWMAPPPWLRQPTGPVWVAEAVPPPDALADVGTQGWRRSRGDQSLPSVLAEAAVPTGEPVFGVPGGFGEDTTGMPPGFGPSGLEASAVMAVPGAGAAGPGMAAAGPGMGAAVAAAPSVPDERVVEAAGTGTESMDPGTAAELSAARYRADLVAGLEPDEDTADTPAARASSRQRRVPIDVQSSGSPGPQARPTARSTGSREWEGPRRFEAYAATQRRRPPTSVLVGGGAVALVVLLLGVFLLPGMLMGSAPAATGTPEPTGMTAAVDATRAPSEPTSAPDRTQRPERTPKPKTYTVKSGDTLIKIAKRFKVTVAKLTCMNRIKDPNNVALGRTLTIPPKGYRCPRD